MKMDRLSQLPAVIFTHIIKYISYKYDNQGIYHSNQNLFEMLCVYNKRWQGIVIRNQLKYTIILNIELKLLNNTYVMMKNNKQIYKHYIKNDVKNITLKQYNSITDRREIKAHLSFNSANIDYKYLQYCNSLNIDETFKYTKIPSYIFELTNLTILTINNQPIKNFPDELCNLTNLQILSMYNLHLHNISTKIHQLCNLTTLNLSSNCLSKIPNEICELFNLISLDISGNSITDLPISFSKLINLQKLIAVKTYFDEIPQCVFSLTKLTDLDFYNNNIYKIPDDIYKLTELYYIDLSENLISSINPNFYQLKKLNMVGLGYNCLNYNEQVNLRKMNYKNLWLECQFEDENYILERRDRHNEGIYTGDEDSDDSDD